MIYILNPFHKHYKFRTPHGSKLNSLFMLENVSVVSAQKICEKRVCFLAENTEKEIVFCLYIFEVFV